MFSCFEDLFNSRRPIVYLWYPIGDAYAYDVYNEYMPLIRGRVSLYSYNSITNKVVKDRDANTNTEGTDKLLIKFMGVDTGTDEFYLAVDKFVSDGGFVLLINTSNRRDNIFNSLSSVSKLIPPRYLWSRLRILDYFNDINIFKEYVESSEDHEIHTERFVSIKRCVGICYKFFNGVNPSDSELREYCKSDTGVVLIHVILNSFCIDTRLPYKLLSDSLLSRLDSYELCRLVLSLYKDSPSSILYKVPDTVSLRYKGKITATSNN